MAESATSPEALALHQQSGEDVLHMPLIDCEFIVAVRAGMIAAELAAGANAV